MSPEGALRRGGSMDRTLDDFSLIETMRFEPASGFIRLRLHLARLDRSARRLGFPAPQDVTTKLCEAVAGATGPLRVRLTFDRRGRIDITTTAFAPLPLDAIWRVRIATTRLDSADKLLRAKTTRRAIYEAARAEYSVAEADEVRGADRRLRLHQAGRRGRRSREPEHLSPAESRLVLLEQRRHRSSGGAG